ncbi:unnamed protein product [Dibothriocephalus latus]|uniref:Uncharacterized protein n=1 Tax=Dibothriocephalus latus TaxID=60516 RepID=A0A3P7PIA9_DIBLA|nr:unnamed protein product [Dibothriocephalus latus]
MLGTKPNTTCTHNQQNDEGDQAAPSSAAREGSTNLPSTLLLHNNTQGQQSEATNDKPEIAVEKSGCGASLRDAKKVDVEKMYTEYMDTVRVNRRSG